MVFRPCAVRLPVSWAESSALQEAALQQRAASAFLLWQSIAEHRLPELSTLHHDARSRPSSLEWAAVRDEAAAWPLSALSDRWAAASPPFARCWEAELTSSAAQDAPATAATQSEKHSSDSAGQTKSPAAQDTQTPCSPAPALLTAAAERSGRLPDSSLPHCLRRVRACRSDGLACVTQPASRDATSADRR